MARQLFICMDGTWNDPTERTNVYKLFTLLPGQEQAVDAKGGIRAHKLKSAPGALAWYLEGVGAKGREQEVLGGGLGVGLHGRVIDAFLLVSQAYQPGDKIWIFGFSRGSWSARSLAGLIAGAGLLSQPGDADAEKRAHELWFRYKHHKTGADADRCWQGKDDKPIRLVGVWDTVGALGVPFFNGLHAVDVMEKQLFDFADLDLSPRVEYGRHALAIDEKRFDFTPTLWHDRDGVEQAWFAGVHADVGGGYSHAGLSDIALRWMVEQCNGIEPALQLDCARLGGAFAPDALQDRHDESRNKIWHARPIEARKIPAAARLHDSVLDRLQGRADYRPAALAKLAATAPFFADAGQAPEERLLPLEEVPATRHLQAGESVDCIVFANLWWNAAGVEVRKGERYAIEASGEWIDKDYRASADGYSAPSVWLKLFEGSRRVEDASWFALIGVIHDDTTLELKNPTAGNLLTGGVESLMKGVSQADKASQLMPVGTRATITAGRDGYLYFFANDSAFAYSNNKGFLAVKITGV